MLLPWIEIDVTNGKLDIINEDKHHVYVSILRVSRADKNDKNLDNESILLKEIIVVRI